MKWPYTSAVVTRTLHEEILEIADSTAMESQSETGSWPISRAWERETDRALDAGSFSCIVSYRSVMNGWNRTHAELAHTFERAELPVRDTWTSSVERDYLSISPGSTALTGLPMATLSLQPNGVDGQPGACGRRAFLYAMKDALKFVLAMNCPLLVAARCVGPSTGGGEYSDAR